MTRSRNSRKGSKGSRPRCYDCNDMGCEWCRPKGHLTEAQVKRALDSDPDLD